MKTKPKTNMKRVLAFITCIAMIVTMMPMLGVGDYEAHAAETSKSYNAETGVLNIDKITLIAGMSDIQAETAIKAAFPESDTLVSEVGVSEYLSGKSGFTDTAVTNTNPVSCKKEYAIWATIPATKNINTVYYNNSELSVEQTAIDETAMDAKTTSGCWKVNTEEIGTVYYILIDLGNPEHNNTYMISKNEQHRTRCQSCNKWSEFINHSFDLEGKCICGADPKEITAVSGYEIGKKWKDVQFTIGGTVISGTAINGVDTGFNSGTYSLENPLGEDATFEENQEYCFKINYGSVGNAKTVFKFNGINGSVAGLNNAYTEVYIKLDPLAHTHEYSDVWERDSEGHWKGCTKCSVQSDKISHSYINGSCVCGSHEHNWSSEWTKDATHHWHKCTAANCDASKGEYEAHSFSSGTCTVCGQSNVVTEINITGVVKPVIGKDPVIKCNLGHDGINVPAIFTVFWTRIDGDKVSDTYSDGKNVENNPFRTNEKYCYQLGLAAVSGYTIPDDVVVKYEGTEVNKYTEDDLLGGSTLSVTENIAMVFNGNEMGLSGNVISIQIYMGEALAASTVVLDKLIIEKEPNKTQYIEGEKFDTTGMIVNAVYSDNSREELSPLSSYITNTDAEALLADTEYINIKVTHNGVTKEIKQHIDVITPSPNVVIDQTETYTFPPATVGYVAQVAKTITVTNNGTAATGPITISLDGTNPTNFTLSKNTINSLSAGGQETFTVVPSTGLAAGTYTATVNVVAASGTNAFDISFTVNPSTPTTYQVTFNVDGGSAVADQTVNSGAKATKPADPTKAGFTFVGWYADNAFTTEFDFVNTAITANTEIFAKWAASGGSGSGSGSGSGGSGSGSGGSGSGSGSGGSGSGSGSGGGADPADSANTQAASDIANAKTGDTVTMTLPAGKTEVGSEVFKALAGKDVTLEIKTGGITWEINGKDIPKNANFKNLNLGVSKNTNNIPVNVINAITGESETMQISLKHNGDFGFTMTMHINLGSKNKGLFANLYYYNPSSKIMEFMTSGIIGNNGAVALDFNHASDYAVVIDDNDHGAEVVNPFTDVKESAYYYDAVLWAVEKGITSGVTKTTFVPNDTCTRAQFVTFLWRANGSPAAAGVANPFTDVAEGAYYYDAVLWAISKNITSGTSATEFSPNAKVTRGQVATFLWRANGSPVATAASFTDVKADAFYADAVAWAVANGITNGTSEGKFSPNADCTRAQVVTFLYRAFQ